MKHSNIHTITETMTENEIIPIPKKKFYNILSNYRDNTDKLQVEKLQLEGAIKGHQEREEIYKKFISEIKEENILLKNKLEVMTKKTVSNKDLADIDLRINEKDDYFLKNKEKIVNEYYEKHFKQSNDELRRELLGNRCKY
jgi:hypothetical protein